MTDMAAINPNFEYDETDQRVWREEIDPFLPQKVFDFHGHVYLKEHKAPPDPDAKPAPSSPKVVNEYPHEAFKATEETLWPGREIRALIFGSPSRGVDYDGVNAYAADAARQYGWDALIVPRIDDDADTLRRNVEAGGFLGFKPYWSFVTWKGQADVTLEDMVTPAMREVANERGLIIMTHIPRLGRLADPVNIDGLRKLCDDCPNAKIIMAHFGRAYFPEAVGDGYSLCDIDNLYPELSMVQDWEVIQGVLESYDRSKVLFGLDLPVAQEKGKCLGVNGQRHFFTKKKHPWSIHAEPGIYDICCTNMAYEMVRAIAKASDRAGLSRDEVEGIFWDNAERIVDSVKEGV